MHLNIFRELFPDLVMDMELKLQKFNEIRKQNEKEAAEKALQDSSQQDAVTNNGTAYNLCINVIILVIFAVFVCIVKKIYESGEDEN